MLWAASLVVLAAASLAGGPAAQKRDVTEVVRCCGERWFSKYSYASLRVWQAALAAGYVLCFLFPGDLGIVDVLNARSEAPFRMFRAREPN